MSSDQKCIGFSVINDLAAVTLQGKSCAFGKQNVQNDCWHCIAVAMKNGSAWKVTITTIPITTIGIEFREKKRKRNSNSLLTFFVFLHEIRTSGGNSSIFAF